MISSSSVEAAITHIFAGWEKSNIAPGRFAQPTSEAFKRMLS
jgi:hypothetical protein